MNFENIIVYPNDRFSIQRDVDTGNYFVEFPAYNSFWEYSDYYFISESEYKTFAEDFALLKTFIQECKDQKWDERSLRKLRNEGRYA